MGRNELSLRENWQSLSAVKASTAEEMIRMILEYAGGENYVVNSHPKNFKHIYEGVILDKETIKEIYNPNETWIHGMVPDISVKNIKTGKSIFIEIKRQDGWVEETERKAGRGNAHERSNKLFTPGLMKILRDETKIHDKDFLPFWVIFVGDITRDPKRVREITLWYEGFENNFYMLRKSHDENVLINHFEKYIKPRLEKNVN